jgi:hypothetical protein
LSNLPENAFLAAYRQHFPERFSWMARRNSLFASASVEEKKVLIDLADWYAAQRFELLSKPNIFSQSATAMAFRSFAWMAAALDGKPVRAPSWEVRMLAKVAKLIDWCDARLIGWQCRRFQQRLTQLVNLEHDADTMLGVVYVLRALPVEFSLVNSAQLPTALSALAEASLTSLATPATRLLSKVTKLILQEEATAHQQQLGAGFPDLKEHVWPLLLRASEQDRPWALRFVDEHWRPSSKWSAPLSTLHLHGQSEVAHRLAVTLRPDRPEFAADIMLEAVHKAGWVATEKMSEAQDPLTRLLDESCDHLWDWIHEPLKSGATHADLRGKLDSLFRYGNPKSPYWVELPACALRAAESISPDAQAWGLAYMSVQAIFYSDPGSPTAIRAMELFKDFLARRSLEADAAHQLFKEATTAADSISVLQGGILSGRNRFFPAHPQHPLMQVVANYLDETCKKLRDIQPTSVLADHMSLTLGIRVETLYRRLMNQFQTEFALRVESFPADAGLALKNLIQYTGYSQTDDDMYRKQVCKDVFDALIHSLDEVSPADAAVARSGIGWSPRGDI